MYEFDICVIKNCQLYFLLYISGDGDDLLNAFLFFIFSYICFAPILL